MTELFLSFGDCKGYAVFDVYIFCVKVMQCVSMCCLCVGVKVMQWMRDSDLMLVAGLVCPTCLQEAEALKKEHDQFQHALEVCEGEGKEVGVAGQEVVAERWSQLLLCVHC